MKNADALASSPQMGRGCHGHFFLTSSDDLNVQSGLETASRSKSGGC